MIFELSIKDFILIRDVKIGFDQGLNILTGETGAGKSMVLGAINMVLGGHASKESIRLGAEKASIRASFLSSPPINAALSALDIITDDEVLVISREINSKGKSISRVNSQVVTLSQLKGVTDQLLNIHGQNEHQNLLERDHQMILLDAFGGDTLFDVKEEVFIFYSAMQTLETEISRLNKKSNERNKQLDFLNFQIQEIEQSKLKIDEDIELERAFDYLSNLEHIQSSVTLATNWLTGDFGEGALTMMSQLGGQFKKLEGFNLELDALSVRLKELYYIMDDLSKDLDRFNEKLEMDPEKFSFLESRLDTINHLKSKYGKQITDILAYLAKIKAEYSEYEAIETLISDKKEALEKAKERYLHKAAELTQLRKKTAILFEKSLESELQALNMKATSFKVEIETSKQPLQTGMDDIEFIISTNIGQPSSRH